MTDRASASESEAFTMRQELDQMRAQATRPAAGHTVSHGDNGRVELRYGPAELYRGHELAVGPGGVVASMPNPKTVMYQGMEVSREVAERMGWVEGYAQYPTEVQRRIQAQNPRAQAGELQEPPETVTEEQAGDHVAQAMTAANDALNRAYDANGAATAEALEAAVVDGDFNPAGFASAEVKAVVDGFTAWANQQIADTGASVALMSEVLDKRALQEARRAVINGDVSKLRSIAGQTRAALADLPRTDPKAFELFIGTHLRDIAFERDGRGGWLVMVNDQMIPWAAAVRAGAVKV